MLRPHGGPQNHLLRNATIIFMFRMYLNRFLYPFELVVFGVTLRFWQLRSNATGKSSHLSIYPYVRPRGDLRNSKPVLFMFRMYDGMLTIIVRFRMYQEMFL